jgi:hypothetical protein
MVELREHKEELVVWIDAWSVDAGWDQHTPASVGTSVGIRVARITSSVIGRTR